MSLLLEAGLLSKLNTFFHKTPPVAVSVLCISLEKKTKIKFTFLYQDIEFDLPNCV